MMSEEAVIILAYVIGVCGAVAVACWVTASGLPLFGLVFLTGLSVKSKTKETPIP